MIRMKNILRASATMLLFVVAGASSARAQDETAPDMEAINVARAVAIEWLALVDDGDYQESWSQAASPVQDAVTLDGWTTSLQDARGPLEPFGERTLVDSREMTNPPGAPEGEYVLVEENEVWKVIGYFVQPGAQAG